MSSRPLASVLVFCIHNAGHSQMAAGKSAPSRCDDGSGATATWNARAAAIQAQERVGMGASPLLRRHPHTSP